jgi:hypothetical protein
MSKKQTSFLGKIEWLTGGVDVVLNGLLGAIGLAIAFEAGSIVFNPDHTVVFLGLTLNWHFTNALQLGILEILVFFGIIIWKPVKVGIQETQAQLFMLNLKNDYTHLKEALDTEEGQLAMKDILRTIMEKAQTEDTPNGAHAQKLSEMVDQSVRTGTGTSDPSELWRSVNSSTDAPPSKKSD